VTRLLGELLVQGVLGVQEHAHAAGLLTPFQNVRGEQRLTRTALAENLYDLAARDAAPEELAAAQEV
jgi:hypothetical protein